MTSFLDTRKVLGAHLDTWLKVNRFLQGLRTGLGACRLDPTPHEANQSLKEPNSRNYYMKSFAVTLRYMRPYLNLISL